MDSSCDLPDHIIKKMDIDVLPLYIVFGNDTYKDDEEISTKELFDLVEENKQLPKTAAVTLGQYIDHFKKYLDQGYEVIYFSISSKFSSCYQNAVVAASELGTDKVYVVDSANLSSGIGLSVCVAHDLIQEGKEPEEIVKIVESVKQRVKTSFIIDTLDYLHKGGRCSAMQSVVSSMLNIRPIIKVVDGMMIVGFKVRGKKKKGIDMMIEEILEDKDRLDYKRVFITHTIGSEEEEKYIREILEKELYDVEIIQADAGAVISSHCGKKTIGILYIVKE